jgi:dihydrofolate synthase / folylpolyglutamate synthase
LAGDASLDSSYSSALDFLYGFVDYERTFGWKYNQSNFTLDNISTLLAALGDPHTRGWFVHVAGTNGKGSVCAMIASTLREAGLKVGLYTSPHLVTFRERIRVNGRVITRREVVEAAARIRKASEVIPGLTFFDVWTALAFDYFARRGVDASVIEVGMGGRLDSTNVITPAVSIITPVSMDHRGRLGETPAEIAVEKAGIVKPGIPVVSAPQTPDVAEVISRAAAENGSDLVVVGRDAAFGGSDGVLAYHGRHWTIDRVRTPLAGDFQLANAATALAALEILSSLGYPITADDARRGIERARWPGRLETIARNPEIVVDGACNIDAMTVAVRNINARSPREKTVAVAAMCRDKDIAEVLAILGKAASRIVFTQARNPRALDAGELAAKAPAGIEAFIEPDPAEALKRASMLAGKDGLVLVAGSLYLVGEVFRLYGIGEKDE